MLLEKPLFEETIFCKQNNANWSEGYFMFCTGWNREGQSEDLDTWKIQGGGRSQHNFVEGQSREILGEGQ